MASRTSTRRAAALLAAASALTGLTACGGGDAPRADVAPQQPAVPFPPQAAEPPNTRGDTPEPAGQVARIGGRPEGIAIDAQSRTVAVATNGAAPTLALFDVDTLRLRRTVTLPAPARHVQASDGRFLVPLETIDRLAVVRASGGDAEILPAGDHPHDATAVGRDLVVADEFGGTATILRDGRRRATLDVDVQPGGIAPLGNDTAAIVSVRAYTVALIDLRTLTVGPSQNAGVGPTHIVAAPDGRIFVADTRGGAVLEYETRPRLKALARVATGAAYGISLDEQRGRLWITDTRAGEVVELDVRTAGQPKVLRRLPAVRQPNSAAADPRTGAVIVAGQRDGLLQRLAP